MATEQGLSISELNIGASAHDICAVSIISRAAEIQGNCLGAFCTANSLTLNSTKTEAVVFTKDSHEVQVMHVAGQHLHTQSGTKICLGVWLEHDLSSFKSIDENIAKARRALFPTKTLGALQGICNPLTSHSILEIFVIPSPALIAKSLV